MKSLVAAVDETIKKKCRCRAEQKYLLYLICSWDLWILAQNLLCGSSRLNLAWLWLVCASPSQFIFFMCMDTFLPLHMLTMTKQRVGGLFEGWEKRGGDLFIYLFWKAFQGKKKNNDTWWTLKTSDGVYCDGETREALHDKKFWHSSPIKKKPPKKNTPKNQNWPSMSTEINCLFTVCYLPKRGHCIFINIDRLSLLATFHLSSLFML